MRTIRSACESPSITCRRSGSTSWATGNPSPGSYRLGDGWRVTISRTARGYELAVQGSVQLFGAFGLQMLIPLHMTVLLPWLGHVPQVCVHTENAEPVKVLQLSPVMQFGEAGLHAS